MQTIIYVCTFSNVEKKKELISFAKKKKLNSAEVIVDDGL